MHCQRHFLHLILPLSRPIFAKWSADRVPEHELNAGERGRELRMGAVQHAASGGSTASRKLSSTRQDPIWHCRRTLKLVVHIEATA